MGAFVTWDKCSVSGDTDGQASHFSPINPSPGNQPKEQQTVSPSPPSLFFCLSGSPSETTTPSRNPPTILQKVSKQRLAAIPTSTSTSNSTTWADAICCLPGQLRSTTTAQATQLTWRQANWSRIADTSAAGRNILKTACWPPWRGRMPTAATRDGRKGPMMGWRLTGARRTRMRTRTRYTRMRKMRLKARRNQTRRPNDHANPGRRRHVIVQSTTGNNPNAAATNGPKYGNCTTAKDSVILQLRNREGRTLWENIAAHFLRRTRQVTRQRYYDTRNSRLAMGDASRSYFKWTQTKNDHLLSRVASPSSGCKGLVLPLSRSIMKEAVAWS
ncbi:hypothetical protein IWX90DRAFT_87334 [Phyllosticta citrichinensis]|uniref:Uncharacterized protein n=1 Tax=Phyllosticta citrichinensis TaxID=1130410 RepID=A0ABR1XFF0_9PEZI